MASAFGHAAASLGLSQLGLVKKPDWKLLMLGVAVSILPDIDSIGYKHGVPYDSFWGHRGFTHSILFAILVALTCALFYRRSGFAKQAGVFGFIFISCASHAVLDAMTTGGLGVAFFSPFDNSRYFFPFRPIKVSPIDMKSFFSKRGLLVLESEAVWIGTPAILLAAGGFVLRKMMRRKATKSDY